MIARLKGKVDLLGDDFLVLDVNGVGYQVYCSSRTLRQYSLNVSIMLEIETYVREDNIQLFGFNSVQEKDFFRLLTVVPGVGAKVALAILGSFPLEELGQIISIGDKASLTRASGVGPKLAARIIGELKEKVVFLFSNGLVAGSAESRSYVSEETNSAINEAASGLVNLGYSLVDSRTALMKVAKTNKEEYSVEELIKLGLRELSAAKNS